MERNVKQKVVKITNIINNNRVLDVEISTEPSMRKTNNPYLGRVRKHTAYLGVDFGVSYTAEVNRRREEEGKSGDFCARKSVYESIKGNEYFVKRGEQVYMRLLLKQKHDKEWIWEVDDRPATAAEVKEIEGFLTSSGKGGKNQGLSEGNEVMMRVIKIENIVAVGGTTWSIDM